MALLSIGEFARLSRLSPRALRLYDEQGVLAPARVDPDSGYRWYAPGQLERARLVALLRHLGMPLARIKQLAGLPPGAAAEQVAAYWARAEAEHAARRELAGYLVDRLRGGTDGKRSYMDEVSVREMPDRSLLSLQRHATRDELFLMGKDFIGRLRKAVPRPYGAEGAPFVIYYGEVSQDGDGPVEWCWPVPGERVEEFVSRFPDLTPRTEPAHEEAFVHVPRQEADDARTTVVLESLFAWVGEHRRRPYGGVRQIYVPDPESHGRGPDFDFAVPLR